MIARVVAEAGQGKGEFDYLARAIETAAKVGCWGVKIQLLQPDTIAQPDAPVYWDERRPEIAGQRDTFAAVGCLDYRLVTDLVEVAATAGVELLGTPFDLDAVEALRRAGTSYCKIASGDITHEPLIRMAAEAFPGGLILSAGASTAEEIDRALGWVHDASGRYPEAVLACSLAYPTPWDQAELGRIVTLARSLPCPIGYSDHTPGWVSARVAVGAGATVLEKHFTLDPLDPSVPDNAFALDAQQLRIYVAEANAAAEMMGTGRLVPTDVERPARAGARRSVCTIKDLGSGHRISREDLTDLRPDIGPMGFEPWQREAVIGKTTTVEIPAGAPIRRAAIG